jgi:hypothetical protein
LAALRLLIERHAVAEPAIESIITAGLKHPKHLISNKLLSKNLGV